MTAPLVPRDTTGDDAAQPRQGLLGEHSVGRYAWDVTTDAVTWSDGMYAIYGFEPGEVVPTVDLVQRHKHPDDRTGYDDLLSRLRTAGGDVALWHRIVDARGRERNVVSASTAFLGADGSVVRVEGYTVDVTGPQRTVVEGDVRDALDRFRSGAAVIEQAKGVLMAARGVSAEEAFEILRSTSNDANVKLRTIAESLVGDVARDSPDGGASV